MQKEVSRRRMWLLFLVAAVVMAFFGNSCFFSSRVRIPWRTDFAAARKEALATHKPMFVDLSASWCDPCQYMKSSTWSDRAVARAMGAYIPVAVDVDAQPELAAQFYTHGLPTFYIVDPATQNILNGHVGALGPDDFLQWLQDKDDLNKGLGPDDDPTFPPTTRATTNP